MEMSIHDAHTATGRAVNDLWKADAIFGWPYLTDDQAYQAGRGVPSLRSNPILLNGSARAVGS